MFSKYGKIAKLFSGYTWAYTQQNGGEMLPVVGRTRVGGRRGWRRTASGFEIYTHAQRRLGYQIGKRRDNPRHARWRELDKQIRGAKTVEAVKSLESIVENDRAYLGETRYRRLRIQVVGRLNRVGTKEKSIDLGPAGKLGVKSQGKLL